MQSRESIDIDVSRYLLMFKRHWLTAALVLTTTVSISAVATTVLKPSYEASGKLLFRTPSFQILQGENAGELRSLTSQNPINNQIEIIFSNVFLQKVIDKLELKNLQGEPLEVRTFSDGLSLKIVGGTDVLRVTYISQDAKESAEIVNTIMSLYLENDILINSGEAEATREFLTKRLPQNEAAVNSAGLALRRFKQKNNIVDIAEESKLFITIKGNLDNEINNAKSQLEDINAQSNELKQKIDLTPEESIIVSDLSQSITVQEILKNLQAVDIQLATERSRFFDDNPIIINLLAKKANLNNILKNEVKKVVDNKTKVPQETLQIGTLKQNLIQSYLQLETQRAGLIQKLAYLNQTRSVYDKKVKLIPQLIQKQHDLEKNLEVAESTYQAMLKKIQELQIAEKKNTANGKIIAKAVVPEKAVSGKKALFLVLGVLSGIFFGTTIVLFIELRDNSLKTLQGVKDIFNYTFLGTVPLLNKKANNQHHQKEGNKKYITVRDAPYSLASEMYRMIQANLRLLSSDKILNTIVVTSAVAKEGKSTIAANLSAVLAQLGYRVLLVDADMRLPSQQEFWQVKTLFGLSEVLVAQAEFEVAVCKAIDNLDILAAGVRPPNPLALIDSKRMASLIKEFSTQYDFVIIDSPPLLVGADALTLSKMTDGILLVANPDVLDFNSAINAKEILNNSQSKVLGLVVNGLSNQDNSNNNYLYNFPEYFKTETPQNPLVSIWKKIK